MSDDADDAMDQGERLWLDHLDIDPDRKCPDCRELKRGQIRDDLKMVYDNIKKYGFMGDAWAELVQVIEKVLWPDGKKP